jgi:hypothetical protein
MKKMIISLLFCFVTVYLSGQDFCMYVRGQKICHEFSVSKMVVKSEILDIAGIGNVLQNTVAGNLEEITDLLFDGLFYVEMQNVNMENMQELIRQWNSREDIIYTSPVFFDERSIEGSTYTNEILVRLKSIDDYPVLQKSAALYHINDIKPSGIDEWTYLLTLPHNPEKDAAEVSIELYETGLFEYAQPNIITLWPFGIYPNGNMTVILERTTVFHPNPVNDILYVDLEKFVHTKNKTSASCDIRLYDSQGKIYRQTKATDGTVEFSVSNLPNGIYFLNIYNESISKPETHKIIVKH